METMPERKSNGLWVQTDRAAHEAWAELITKSPLAARIMHLLVSRIGEHNAVVVSQRTIADLLECSERGVRDAMTVLRRGRWVEVRQVGNRGTVNAYVINSHVAWSGPRDGIRYALLSAALVLSSAEQPDDTAFDDQPALRPIPIRLQGEQQLPTGDGLPPPSEPSLPGMEIDLPSIERDESDDAIRIGDLINKGPHNA